MMSSKSNKPKFSYKKGRRLLLLPFFLLIACHPIDLAQYGRITPNNTSNKDSFIFSVSDEFLSSNSNSPKDKVFSKMTKAEADLIKILLKQKKYCLNKDGIPFFVITSRQEKIYDMTYAHLIEQNYKARPIAPRMYFGKCEKE